MSDNVWVRFFPSDWLAGTRGMTAAETGIYISLIAMMYENDGYVKDDRARLARLCGASGSAFKKAIQTLIEGEKIITRDGRLTNDRVLEELSYSREKSSVAREAAKKRWEKTQQKQGPSNANAMPSQSGRNANQKPEPEYGSNEPADRPSEKPVIPSPAKPQTNGIGSDEDQFWKLAGDLQNQGVARSLCGRLANVLNGAFDEGVGILRDVAKAKKPTPYLTKIIQNRQQAPPPLLASDEPEFVRSFRTHGYSVERLERGRWRCGGAIYDAAGQQVGG